MANYSIDGQTFSRDVQQDRMAAGTVGDTHVVRNSLSPQSINQELAMTDPRIQYNGGALSGAWSLSFPTASRYRHSQIAVNRTAGAQLVVNFTGSKVGIIGSLRSDAGQFAIYIDGNLTNGVTYYSGYVPFTLPAGQQSAPTSSSVYVLSATTTSIACDATSFSGFPSSGTIRIDNEYITYSSKDNLNNYFTGCTRGASGSVAVSHPVGANVFNVSSTVDPYTVDHAYRQLLWTADNLPSGQHQLVLQVLGTKNASSTDYLVYIEGIVIGGLIGSRALNIEHKSYNVGSVVVDATGFAIVGGLNIASQDAQLISILGVRDDTHKLGWQYDKDGNIWVYGAAATYTNVTISYVVVGRSL